MARKVDPICEAKRAMTQVLSAKKHLDMLPEEFRQVLFSSFPHQRAVTLTLSATALDTLLNAFVAVEHTHDRLEYLLMHTH